MPQLWPNIQYLPDTWKDASFYSPGNQGKYERALAENYQRLKQIPRSTNLRLLKKKLKKS